jgi:WD40 repeat protein
LLLFFLFLFCFQIIFRIQFVMAYLAVTASESAIEVYRYAADQYELEARLVHGGDKRSNNFDVHCFAPDSSSVIGSVKHCILFWDITVITGADSNEIPNIVSSACIQIDPRDVAVGEAKCVDGRSVLAIRTRFPEWIIMIDITSQCEIWRLNSETLSDGHLNFTRNNELIITSNVIDECNEGIIVIDALSGNVLVSISTQEALFGFDGCDFAAHPSEPLIAVCARKIEYIVVLGLSPLYDSIEETRRRRLRGHTEAVTCTRFSDCGLKLISASDDETIRLWSTVTWDVLLFIRTNGQLYKFAYSSDDNMLASCVLGNDYAQVCNCESGQLAMESMPSVGRLCFSKSAFILM